MDLEQSDASISLDNLNVMDYFKSNLNKKYQSHTPLSAETFQILSAVIIETIPFDIQFELLFNDLSMLRAAAIKGLLGQTRLRCLGWMIFLGYLPMDKTLWQQELFHKRAIYEKIRREMCCDPHQAPKYGQRNFFDHPLSQDTEVFLHLIRNSYFLIKK